MHKIKSLVFYKIACGASQFLYEIAGQLCVKACMILIIEKVKNLIPVILTGLVFISLIRMLMYISRQWFSYVHTYIIY